MKIGDKLYMRLAYVNGLYTWVKCLKDHPDACCFELKEAPPYVNEGEEIRDEN